MEIQEAIEMVKAAGYTVRKVATRKRLSCVGPTFRAVWPDGEVTRMTIHCGDEKPDLQRAVRVSHAAYQFRCKRLKHLMMDDFIVNGSFERNGIALHNYTDIPVREYL